MATPIQPNFQSQVASPRVDSPRNAAQRAFFQAALNGTAPTAAAVEPVPTQRPAPVQRIKTEIPAEAPTRLLRPGTFLDIRV
ncbi:MAG: hypothetical protein CGW95_05700 [Phenylobacterium zucineum]|nr:MAG: hypothetical protein CGW95_05700 [Phenylobacterium zucineum]